MSEKLMKSAEELIHSFMTWRRRRHRIFDFRVVRIAFTSWESFIERGQDGDGMIKERKSERRSEMKQDAKSRASSQVFHGRTGMRTAAGISPVFFEDISVGGFVYASRKRPTDKPKRNHRRRTEVRFTAAVSTETWLNAKLFLYITRSV